MPCESYTREQLREAVRRATLLLSGVGKAPLRRESMGVSVQVRCQLSPKEVSGLPLAWRYIPGRDMAGEGAPITDEDLR